jgi:hypothetical protein
VRDAEPFVGFSTELRAHLRRRKAEVRVVVLTSCIRDETVPVRRTF